MFCVQARLRLGVQIRRRIAELKQFKLKEYCGQFKKGNRVRQTVQEYRTHRDPQTVNNNSCSNIDVLL